MRCRRILRLGVLALLAQLLIVQSALDAHYWAHSATGLRGEQTSVKPRTKASAFPAESNCELCRTARAHSNCIPREEVYVLTPPSVFVIRQFESHLFAGPDVEVVSTRGPPSLSL